MLEPGRAGRDRQGAGRRRGRPGRPLRAFELAVERARYEADRARRQYDACEPENRLVARTLEAAWEDKLAASAQAETALAAEQARRPAADQPRSCGWLSRAGADVRAVFDAPTTTPRERKQLLRALLTEVVVTVDRRPAPPRHDYWEGGASTELTVTLPRLGAP